MTDKRPSLTKGAKESLEQFQQRIRNTICNIAEKRVLDEGRTEISEADILKVQKGIPIITRSTLRKWCIRILMLLTFASLFAQVSAFYQLHQSIDLQTLPFIIQVWLVLPAILILILMIIFTLIFREDWL